MQFIYLPLYLRGVVVADRLFACTRWRLADRDNARTVAAAPPPARKWGEAVGGVKPGLLETLQLLGWRFEVLRHPLRRRVRLRKRMFLESSVPEHS